MCWLTCKQWEIFSHRIIILLIDNKIKEFIKIFYRNIELIIASINCTVKREENRIFEAFLYYNFFPNRFGKKLFCFKKKKEIKNRAKPQYQKLHSLRKLIYQMITDYMYFSRINTDIFSSSSSWSTWISRSLINRRLKEMTSIFISIQSRFPLTFTHFVIHVESMVNKCSWGMKRYMFTCNFLQMRRTQTLSH